MNTYSPIFSSITDSSLWREEDFVCKAFITLLAIKDMNHVAHVTAFMLGQKCWPTDPKAEKIALDAISILQSPDTKRIEKQPFDGRRIEKVEDGYLILNGQYYEDMARNFSRKLYKSRKEREYRLENKKKTQAIPVAAEQPAALKKTQPEDEIPQALKTPEFLSAWEAWKKYRTENHWTTKPSTMSSQLKKFSEWGVDRAIAAINHTIFKGWQGVAEPGWSKSSSHADQNLTFAAPPRADLKPWTPDPIQQRLNKFMLFPRPDSQPWSDLEQDAFDQVKNKITEQHFAMVERFHSSPIKDGDFRFKSLLKLLQNWFSEVKKSREFLRENPMLCLPPGFNNPGRNPGETNEEYEERGRQQGIYASGGRVRGEIVLDSDPSEEDPEGENEND